MLPFIQIDKEVSSLLLTDTNRIVNLNWNENTYRFNKQNADNIQFFDLHPLNADVKGLVKKDDFLFSYCKLVIFLYIVGTCWDK